MREISEETLANRIQKVIHIRLIGLIFTSIESLINQASAKPSPSQVVY